MPPRFPVLWITVLIFAMVAGSAQDEIVGCLFFALILPAVLIGQTGIRALFRRFRSPVWLRRTAMLLPALLLACGLFHSSNRFGGSQTAAITVALAQHTPTGLRELQVHEDAWTDYVVVAYFRCDPASLRAILEQPPFIRSDYQPGVFSFAETRFPDLQSRPDVHDAVVFQRTDLEPAKGSCKVYTDSTFGFAYLTYAVD